MRPVVHQKVKHEQPMAQEGHPRGAPNVTNFSKSKGRLTFATLGHRGGPYHLFQGQNRIVGICNHSPLIETKVVEHYKTAGPRLLVKPIMQLRRA